MVHITNRIVMGVRSMHNNASEGTFAAACGLPVFFFLGELVGGYFAGSIATMREAAHSAPDMTDLLISLFERLFPYFSPSEFVKYFIRGMKC